MPVTGLNWNLSGPQNIEQYDDIHVVRGQALRPAAVSRPVTVRRVPSRTINVLDDSPGFLGAAAFSSVLRSLCGSAIRGRARLDPPCRHEGGRGDWRRLRGVWPVLLVDGVAARPVVAVPVRRPRIAIGGGRDADLVPRDRNHTGDRGHGPRYLERGQPRPLAVVAMDGAVSDVRTDGGRLGAARIDSVASNAPTALIPVAYGRREDSRAD
jgi:hypothetical protein